jgi:hypothetical protein
LACICSPVLPPTGNWKLFYHQTNPRIFGGNRRNGSPLLFLCSVWILYHNILFGCDSTHIFLFGEKNFPLIYKKTKKWLKR